jgi:hypothetical protein
MNKKRVRLTALLRRVNCRQGDGRLETEKENRYSFFGFWDPVIKEKPCLRIISRLLSAI